MEASFVKQRNNSEQALKEQNGLEQTRTTQNNQAYQKATPSNRKKAKLPLLWATKNIDRNIVTWDSIQLIFIVNKEIFPY